MSQVAVCAEYVASQLNDKISSVAVTNCGGSLFAPISIVAVMVTGSEPARECSEPVGLDERSAIAPTST